MLSKEAFRQQAALSIIQGVLEGKYGVIGELDPDVAVKETLRIANKLTEAMFVED